MIQWFNKLFSPPPLNEARDWAIVRHKHTCYPDEILITKMSDVDAVAYDVFCRNLTFREAEEASSAMESGPVMCIHDMEAIPGKLPAYVIVGELWYIDEDIIGSRNEPMFVQHGWRKEIMRLCWLQRLPGVRLHTRHEGRIIKSSANAYAGVVVPMNDTTYKRFETIEATWVIAALCNILMTYKEVGEDRLATANRNLQRAREAETAHTRLKAKDLLRSKRLAEHRKAKR